MPIDETQTGRQEAPSAAERMEEIEDDLEMMARQVTGFIADQARENPYRTVLVAAGVGYVLGGGIPSWALRLGAQAAARMAIASAVAQVTGTE